MSAGKCHPKHCLFSACGVHRWASHARNVAAKGVRSSFQKRDLSSKRVLLTWLTLCCHEHGSRQIKKKKICKIEQSPGQTEHIYWQYFTSEKFMSIMNLDYDRQSQHTTVHHRWSVLVCNATNNNGLHISIVKIFGFAYCTAASTCTSCQLAYSSLLVKINSPKALICLRCCLWQNVRKTCYSDAELNYYWYPKVKNAPCGITHINIMTCQNYKSCLTIFLCHD